MTKIRGSLAIAKAEYFKKNNRLHIVMTDGTIYDYWGVPKEVYDEFLASSSKGQFFNAKIRDSYTFSRG